MKYTLPPTAGKVVALLAFACALSRPLFAESVGPKVIAEWTFDVPGDFQGWHWRADGSVTDVQVKDGALTALTTGPDPAFTSPDMEVAAGEVAVVAVRMKLESGAGDWVVPPGALELFWATSTSSDFNPMAKMAAPVSDDGEWRDYYFAVNKSEEWSDSIRQIRIDPCASPSVKISIDSVRLLGGAAAAAPGSAPGWTFDLPGDLQGWQGNQDLPGVAAEDGALTATTTGQDPAFLGPNFNAQASTYPSVVVRVKLENSRGNRVGQLFWTTDESSRFSQEASATTEISGNGEWQECRFDVGKNPQWTGTITGLRFDPGSERNVVVSLGSVRLETSSP